MMGIGAQFNRVKVWNALENLIYSDLNSEFNNVLNNLFPGKIGGNSATLAQMQQTTNPGTVGSENLQTNLAGELQTLRYMIGQITGGAQWYSPPAATLQNLSSVSSVPQNRIISGRSANQPLFLIPAGNAATFTLSTSPFFVVSISGTSYTFTSNIASGSLSLAPSSNNTCLANDTTLTGNEASKYYGERGSIIRISGIGSAITALNNTYQAFKNQTTGELFLAYIDTGNNCLRNCFRGFFFDSSDNWSSRKALVNGDVLQLLKVTYVFATQNSSIPGIDITYNPPVFGFRQPTSPNIGDYFFNFNTQQWLKFTGGVYAIQTALFIGIVCQDTTNCIGARSGDYYGGFTERNNVKLEYLNTTTIQASEALTRVNAYGSDYSWLRDRLNFNSVVDMDTGVTLSANTAYFFYITNLGDKAISNLRPYDRTFDLLGWYHPSKPFRCVGEAQTDASNNFIQSSVAYAPYISTETPLASAMDLKNLSISTQAGSTALTINVQANGFMPASPTSPLSIAFQNPNASSGSFFVRNAGYPLSISIPTTATLGMVPNFNDLMYVYAMDNTVNAGGQFTSMYLGVAGSHIFDEGVLQNAAILNGASTSRYVLYSTTGLSNVPVRLLGSLKVNNSSTGNWASPPLVVNTFGRQQAIQNASEVWLFAGNGHGSALKNVRRFQNIQLNYGSAITYLDSATSGGVFNINEPGLYSISYFDGSTGASVNIGCLKNATSTNANTAISSNSFPVMLGFAASVSGSIAEFSTLTRLLPGDYINAADDATANFTSANTTNFRIIKVAD